MRDRLRKRPVVVSHREIVTSAPSGYAAVARRDGVEVDGLEHRKLPVFSYQFHPEAGTEFAVRAGIDEHRLTARLREDSRRLLAAFRRVVLHSAA